MRNPLICTFAALALGGCILNATPPVFSEADSTLLLGPGAVTFLVFNRENEVWRPVDEDPYVTVLAEGNHYILPDPEAPDDRSKAAPFAFIPLDATHYVVEVREDDGATYAMTTWDGSTLLVSTPDCADLKNDPSTNPLVEFQDYDCTLRPSELDPKALFAILKSALPAPDLKLVVQ